jgi:hypothetical protein
VTGPKPASGAAARDTPTRMGLDEDKLEALRRWGEGLREAGSEGSAAAGRAILMLVEEVQRLRLEELRAREQLNYLTRVASAEAAEDAGERVASTLHGRVQKVLRRDSDSSPEARSRPEEEAGSGTGADEARTAAQSWIEALRRPE